MTRCNGRNWAKSVIFYTVHAFISEKERTAVRLREVRKTNKLTNLNLNCMGGVFLWSNCSYHSRQSCTVLHHCFRFKLNQINLCRLDFLHMQHNGLPILALTFTCLIVSTFNYLFNDILGRDPSIWVWSMLCGLISKPKCKTMFLLMHCTYMIPCTSSGCCPLGLVI